MLNKQQIQTNDSREPNLFTGLLKINDEGKEFNKFFTSIQTVVITQPTYLWWYLIFSGQSNLEVMIFGLSLEKASIQ